MKAEDLAVYDHVVRAIGLESANKALTEVIESECYIIKSASNISEAFLWSDSPQGTSFWHGVRMGIENDKLHR